MIFWDEYTGANTAIFSVVKGVCLPHCPGSSDLTDRGKPSADNWYNMGIPPEEIVLDYPHLTLAQVHAALAYYHVNRDEIEADLAQEEAAALQWEQRLGNNPTRR
jgi:Protein of unknown function (DUF433)